jgi:hypothetical protein
MLSFANIHNSWYIDYMFMLRNPPPFPPFNDSYHLHKTKTYEPCWMMLKVDFIEIKFLSKFLLKLNFLVETHLLNFFY